MLLGGSDYLSVLCLANILPILYFFVQELVLVSAFFYCCFDFWQSDRRFILQESDCYVTVLPCSFYLYNLTGGMPC